MFFILYTLYFYLYSKETAKFALIFQATQKILEQFFNHLVSQGHRKTFTKAEPMRDPIATPSL